LGFLQFLAQSCEPGTLGAGALLVRLQFLLRRFQPSPVFGILGGLLLDAFPRLGLYQESNFIFHELADRVQGPPPPSTV
jgi:hypothetical protein